MSAMFLTPDHIGSLLDEVSRHRALTEEESVALEMIVTRGHRSSGMRTRWTPDMDAALLEAAKVDGGIARHAQSIGVRPMSCHMRLHKLRRTLGKAEGCIGAVQSIQIENGAG